MKLKYYSTQTIPKTSGGRKDIPAKIHFSKSGVITINKAAAELMGLTAATKISMAQDEEDPANWYLFLDPANGYPLRGKEPTKTYNLAFNHRDLQKAVCKALEIDPDESYNFLIGGQPTVMKGDKTKYWGLLLIPKI